MRLEKDALMRSPLWILPFVVSIAPLAILVVQRDRDIQTIAMIVIGFCFLAAIASFRMAHSHNDDDRRPRGLVFIVAANALLAGVSLFEQPVLSGLALIVSAALSVIGMLHLVSFRLGSRPTITEREIAIAVSGIALLFYVLLALPPADETADAIFAFLVTVSAAAALFCFVLTFWLMSIDRESQSPPLFATGLAHALMTVFGALLATGAALDFSGAVATTALGAAVAAYVHPRIADVLTPTVIMASEVNVRRSLVSFSVVLVGPLLIALSFLPAFDPSLPDGLSLPTITVGSSALSIMVAVHLLGLVRRWIAVEHQGQHDPLTDLPNRPLFFSRLELAIESARLRQVRFVTMFLDLDRFKAVNDTLGHEAGDELLRQVAIRLDDASSRVGPDLTVARLGGDEFAIIVPHVKDARHSHAIGRLFLDQFLDPFDVGLRDIYVTPSIGIAEFPKDGNTVEDLIENADTAMFEAKERGRNTVVAYSPEQRVPGAHRLEIEAALHRAIENEELELYYQPQVDITTGKIFAVESLIRWVHPTLGRISPEKFVPVAEESSLIDQMGVWIIEEACRSAARWEEIGLPPINVAVNLSPRQFQKSVHLTDNVTRALRNTGLAPERLELELTESLALEKPEEVNETLERFREMGIRTAIDDFGVGHTGLDYLDRISVDTLKIDRSFINRIGESGAPLVTAVISLAKGLNLDVIAEGVETRKQVNFLASHGCRYMQGYLFSKPLTGPQLEQVLRNQMRRDNEELTAGVSGDLPGEPDMFDDGLAA